MEKKLAEVEQSLKKSLLEEVNKNNTMLSDKLNEVIKVNKSYAEAARNIDQTASTEPVTSMNTDFRKIIKDEKNEQLAEENDKKRRACNLILHGVTESQNNEEVKKLDEEYVKLLFRILGLNKEHKSLCRLGKSWPTINIRPHIMHFRRLVFSYTE